MPITDVMIEAGGRVLDQESPVFLPLAECRRIAENVFRAMQAAQEPPRDDEPWRTPGYCGDSGAALSYARRVILHDEIDNVGRMIFPPTFPGYDPSAGFPPHTPGAIANVISTSDGWYYKMIGEQPVGPFFSWLDATKAVRAEIISRAGRIEASGDSEPKG